MNGQVQKNIASFGSFQSLEHGIVPWPASGALLLGEGEEGRGPHRRKGWHRGRIQDGTA
jgi:hypothetical protein